MNIKCTAIDDEPMALNIIADFCRRLGTAELKTFTNPIDGMNYVKRTKPDILFLDVEMGDICGIDLVKDIPPTTALILTTAYAQYAVDGFELNAVDFLHKPFSYKRFETSINKATERMNMQRLCGSPVFTDEYITLKIEYKNTNIRLGDIHFIEAMDNYVRIHLIGQPAVMPQIGLKNIQELLPEGKFIRIHKSYIVPQHRIASYTSKDVVLYDGTKIPIGRSYSKNVILQ